MSESSGMDGDGKQVAPDVIVGVAKMLGIDVVNEPEYLWIAEQ